MLSGWGGCRCGISWGGESVSSGGLGKASPTARCGDAEVKGAVLGRVGATGDRSVSLLRASFDESVARVDRRAGSGRGVGGSGHGDRCRGLGVLRKSAHQGGSYIGVEPRGPWVRGRLGIWDRGCWSSTRHPSRRVRPIELVARGTVIGAGADRLSRVERDPSLLKTKLIVPERIHLLDWARAISDLPSPEEVVLPSAESQRLHSPEAHPCWPRRSVAYPPWLTHSTACSPPNNRKILG